MEIESHNAMRIPLFFAQTSENLVTNYYEASMQASIQANYNDLSVQLRNHDFR